MLTKGFQTAGTLKIQELKNYRVVSPSVKCICFDRVASVTLLTLDAGGSHRLVKTTVAAPFQVRSTAAPF